MQRINQVDWGQVRRDGFTIFTKLIRTKDPNEAEQDQQVAVPTRQRLSRCLSTLDLVSLGVGSCVGTGMYLVAGMVARKFAGPGVVVSFIIAAIASIFSGACYAEFGVRVPHTTGSAYMYSYVTVGEFIAFIIGWNMILEYLIGTSACARALSACFDTIFSGAVSRYLRATFGTFFGKPPDFLAFFITIGMMFVLVAGVKKSLFFNNLLNAINLSVWVFIVAAGLFYIDTSNWTQHDGFLPYGWSGVFSGAATCFYAFIGFDIIATTGEEAHNPKRSIPLSIVMSLGIILLAYVSSSMILTLIVPYDEVDTESALVQMFDHVHAPVCKYIVALGAVAGLTVSMFGSMFPMPRVIYAMAQDGLIFKRLATICETTGTPAFATIGGGLAAAVVALLIQLEVLVEMMSIGTLLAYTLVSTCVLVLRYQPYSNNLIELLPQNLRTPVPGTSPGTSRETGFSGFQGELSRNIVTSNQRVMVRRVTRSSPDSDDTMPGDESEEYRDDTYLMGDDRTENKFYVGAGSTVSGNACTRLLNNISQRLQIFAYVCPGCFPWVDPGPATEYSGHFVIKMVGVLYILIIIFDLFAAYGSPGESTFCSTCMLLLLIAIVTILLIISRKPQNRNNLMYTTPGLPFVPAIAIGVNIYLILNLSILTLVRFTLWMILGLIMYFKYGIKNSTLETAAAQPPPPPSPQPSVLDRTTIPPAPPRESRPGHDRNIFEGDGGANQGLYANTTTAATTYNDPLLAWHESEMQASSSSSSQNRANNYVEQRYNQRTNATTSHVSRPPWAYPDNQPYGSWDD
ncbi:hypothetical protein JYU34_000719 [Plutella xylostella]|uniref:Cationic amino acid transporter C-terminal domain-containing protein n=1 Tax=Plutella xylostella TaxID=51655 RepID=A0ABQ7R8G0_PLUXY|nr:hypothetical protein JYU34_000719 [Plutella xylostella]